MYIIASIRLSRTVNYSQKNQSICSILIAICKVACGLASKVPNIYQVSCGIVDTKEGKLRECEINVVNSLQGYKNWKGFRRI